MAPMSPPPEADPTRDTPAEVEQRLIERLRRMTPLQRLAMAMDLSEGVRQLAAARIRAQYGPGISERELHLRLAALAVDRDTLIAAFGWDPEVEGY
jgi:hypothetical protein